MNLIGFVVAQLAVLNSEPPHYYSFLRSAWERSIGGEAS